MIACKKIYIKIDFEINKNSDFYQEVRNRIKNQQFKSVTIKSTCPGVGTQQRIRVTNSLTYTLLHVT